MCHVDFRQKQCHLIVPVVFVWKTDVQFVIYRKKTKTVFAIEHLYCIVSSNIIMPFPFSLNILTYYKLNSKTICNMYSSDYHAGSYTYVLKRIEEHPANPITIPFQHDVITYFDNNQVLARNWRYML